MNSENLSPIIEINTFTTKNSLDTKPPAQNTSPLLPGIVLFVLIGIQLLFIAASEFQLPKYIVVIIMLALILIPAKIIAKRNVKRLKEAGFFDKEVDISEIQSNTGDKKDGLPQDVQPANIRIFSDYFEIEFPQKKAANSGYIYELNKMPFNKIEGIEVNKQTNTISFYGDIEITTYHYHKNGELNQNSVETTYINSSCWFKMVNGEETRIIDAIKETTSFEITII